MTSRGTVLSIAVLVLTCWGATPVVAGEFEFAEALAKYGFFDLAEEQFREIMEDSGLTAEERADGEFGLCKIRSYQANNIVDIEERLTKYDEAMECLRNYYTRNPEASKANDARLEVGSIQQQKGRFLSFKMEDEADPNEKAKLKDRALAAYTDAIQEYEKIKTSAEQGTELRQQARYYLLESRWYAGYAGESREHLQKCVSEAEDFVWDYEPSVIAYYAYVLQGMAYCKLGDMASGMARFQTVTAIGLKDLQAEIVPTVIALQAKAYFGIIRAKVEAGQAKESQEFYKAFEDKVPGGKDDFYGQGAMYWSGRGSEDTGDVGRALVVYSRLAEIGGFWGSKAKSRLESVLAGGSNQDIDPKTYFQMAEGYYGQRKWNDAIERFQKVLQAVRARNDPALQGEFLPRTFDLLGDCYFRIDRYQEAALAYEAAGKAGLAFKDDASLAEEHRTKANEVAESASYWSYVAYKRAYYQTYDQVDRTAFETARDFFVGNFPRSPKNENLKFEKAFELEKANKYLEAARAYEDVGTIADSYEESRFRIGYCYYREGLKKLRDRDKLAKEEGADAGQIAALEGEANQFFETAKGKLEEYKKYAATSELIAEEAKEKRAGLLASTLLIIASISLELGQWDDAIANINDDRGEINELIAADPGSIPNALKYLIKAYTGKADIHLAKAKELGADANQGEIDQATNHVRSVQQLVDRLSSQFQGVGGLYFYSYELGKRLQDLYRLTGIKSHQRESNLYYSEWILQKISDGRSVSFRSAYVVGTKLMDMAVDERLENPRGNKADRWFRNCAKIFEVCLRTTTEPQELRASRLRLARVFQETGELESALTQYYELYKTNKKSSETVNALANVFRDIGIRAPAGKNLFEEIVRISKEEEVGSIAEWRSDPQEGVNRGELELRLVATESFLEKSSKDRWLSASQKQKRMDDFQSKYDELVADRPPNRANEAYASWLAQECDKKIAEKYSAIERYVDASADDRAKVVRLLGLDLAVRLFVTIAGRTPPHYQSDLFQKNEFDMLFPFPSNREWWEAKYHLLECYHHLGMRESKNNLYNNISLLNIPKPEDLSKMKTRGDELRAKVDEAADDEARTKAEKRADYYQEYVDMIDTFRERMSQLASQQVPGN